MDEAGAGAYGLLVRDVVDAVVEGQRIIDGEAQVRHVGEQPDRRQGNPGRVCAHASPVPVD